MEKMLVAVFDNESTAYEGSRTLGQLDADGSIAVHAQAVIKKNPDGTATVKELNDEFPVGSLAGTTVGSLIGLLEGPVGLAVGATTGLFAGMVRDCSPPESTRNSWMTLRRCSHPANARWWPTSVKNGRPRSTPKWKLSTRP